MNVKADAQTNTRANRAQAHDREAPLSPARRRFCARLSLLLGGFAATIVGIPVIGFLFGPLVSLPQSVWRSVGKVEDFAVGTTKEVSFDDASPLPWSGVSARTAAWLRREGNQDFTAFSINCTHLGCPVRWETTASLFLCPCHGGVYYQDGKVAAGPPPHPLPKYPVRVRDGQVEVLAGEMPLPANESSKYSNY